MEDQLQKLIELQTEQNQLLKRYLWRLRLSLFGLFLMTTVVAVGLGIIAYHTRPQAATTGRTPLRLTFPTSAVPAEHSAPVGDIQVLPGIPGAS